MASQQQRAEIAAIEAAAAEAGQSAEASSVISAFNTLVNAGKDRLPALRDQLVAANVMGPQEADDVVREAEENGGDSLSFFEFVSSSRLSAAVLQSARRKLAGPAPVFVAHGGEEKGGGGHPRGPAGRQFARDLPHQRALVSEQVQNGLYSVKRVGAYLKKLCTFEDGYAREIIKATQHEVAKIDKSNEDHMKRYCAAWTGVHEVLHQMATQHQEFRDKTMSAVVLPLQAFHKESEEKRKELLEEMARLSKLNKQVFDTMKKSKKKAFELLEHMRAERDKEKGGAPVRKQTDKAGGNWMSKMASAIKSVAADSPEQLREKAAQACAAYKEAVDVSNARQKLFHERELPRLMEEMQQLELARLDVLRDHLTKFAVIFHDCVTPLEELANRLVHNIASMDGQQDIDLFVNDTLEVHGAPPEVIPYEYDLPTDPAELRANRWDGSMEPKSQRQRIFGVTLDEVMRTQSRMHPQAELPVILTTLIEAIKTLRGPETEGIFRISANKSEIDAMHRAFDAGNYEVKSASPHAPAGLLKEWLRELAEPLIPDEVYPLCVEAAKQDVFTEEKALELLSMVPDLNRAVVSELAQFLAQVERRKEVNKMTVDNLAVVFSPSLLRCPSEDPMEMMTNSKSEVRFTAVLFAALFKRF